MSKIQIARILTIIMACLTCGNAYSGEQSDAIVNNIEHLLEESNSDTKSLSEAIKYAGKSNDVLDLEKTLENSKFFYHTYENIRYKVRSENVCDMVVLANSGYIIYLCLDKNNNRIIAENSLAKAKKTLYDLEVRPGVKQ